MTKLTPAIHKFIVENQHIKNPLLADLVERKYKVSFAPQHIGRTKTKPLEQNNVQKSSKKVLKDSSVVPRGKRFVLSVDTLKQLLDKNPNHYWYDYVEEEFIGKNGNAGKLRSDFQKLCEFLRDVMN